MPRIQIKSLDERVATQGIHMGGGPERRKLQPFEVVEIPDDLTLDDGTNLLDLLWNTGRVELTLDDVTRPLDYKTYREARLCAPTFKPRGPDEEVERDRAVDAVNARLIEINAEAVETAVEAPPKTTRRAVPQPRRGRSAKRALNRANQDGETHTT